MGALLCSSGWPSAPNLCTMRPTEILFPWVFSLCMDMCVCGGDVCTCVHVFIGVWAHLSVWACLHVESRTRCRVSVVLHVVYWDRVSHWTPSSPIWPGELATFTQGSACLPLLSAGVTGMCPHIGDIPWDKFCARVEPRVKCLKHPQEALSHQGGPPPPPVPPP